MYSVIETSCWSLTDSKGEVVLDVTSAGYAEFLCELLNSGYTLSDIKNRPHPDREYFKYVADKAREQYN